MKLSPKNSYSVYQHIDVPIDITITWNRFFFASDGSVQNNHQIFINFSMIFPVLSLDFHNLLTGVSGYKINIKYLFSLKDHLSQDCRLQ